MRWRIRKAIADGDKFRREFRRQIRFIVIVTLGFTIAFTWRQTVFDLSYHFVQFFTKIENSSALSVLSSTLITLISLVLIYLTSHFLKESPHRN